MNGPTIWRSDRRQHPSDREAAEVAGPRQDDVLDQVGGPGIAEGGIDLGQRTHGRVSVREGAIQMG